MRNPYRLPLKLKRRRLDELRLAIAEQQERLTAAAARDAVLLAMRASERRLSVVNLELPPSQWFDRVAAERARLARDRAQAEECLVSLRTETVTELAAITALEAAEQRLLAEQRQAIERRAQAAADDRAATLFLVKDAA